MKTYCNPLPIPDYPIGRNFESEGGRAPAWRELADPTVLYEDGVWYLYPSCGMMWWSEDLVTWKHKRLDTYDVGYAPTVVKHRGRWWMLACRSDLYVADSPFGPFGKVGALRAPDGSEVRGDDRELPAPVRALRVRLRIVSHPAGIAPGVIDFTVFGRPPVPAVPAP